MHKFYGQFDPSVDRFIFERYFPSLNIKGVFVECGAFDGLLECSCKFFEETMGWKGFNVEPIPWVYEKLCTNRPSSHNLNAALSSVSGHATFSAVNHPQFGVDCTNGSLAHTEKHKALLEQAGCEFVPVEVSLLTWKDFVEQNGISCVDLLVLDVEGHELSVIDGMHGCTVLPDLICIEVGHLDLDIIRVQLAKLNYVYDISSHVNAFFVKQEKLPLFALRAASRVNGSAGFLPSIASEADGKSVWDSSGPQVDALKLENAHLKQHIDDLTLLYHQVISSKVWRVADWLRRHKL